MEPFENFVARVGPPLRTALVATFGPDAGAVAANEALSWAWEHRSHLDDLNNPVGYLYRVGQTSVRKSRRRLFPSRVFEFRPDDVEGQRDFDPGLVPALRKLSRQQCTTVLLVHAFGWTIRETAEALGIAASSVQIHLDRGLARLRRELDCPAPTKRTSSTAPISSSINPLASRRNDV